MRRHQRVIADPVKRHDARQHFVEHDREAVDIAALVDVLAADLLRRGVGERPLEIAGARHLLRPAHPGDAEIHDLQHALIGDHQVRRLDVAMDDASAMGVAETRHRLRDDGQALAQAEPAHLRQEIVEGVATHQLHDHEGVLAFELKRVERRYVGVIEIGEALCLDVEALD